ncbi:MAG: iron-sulfur cluster assembly protein, partial [Candidatus Diapherotrites archaeon]
MAGENNGKIEAEIREKLKGIIDPHTGIDIVEMGMVKAIEVKGGRVTVRFTPTTIACPVLGFFQEKIKEFAESV